MSNSITGEFFLTDPQREAIYDVSEGCFRFYFKFVSSIPMSDVDDAIALHVPDIVEMERRSLLAEVWVPVQSPARSFEDMSLVYLRGRMALPVPDPEADDVEYFMIYIEVISAHLRGVFPNNIPNSVRLHGHILPESIVLGRVLSLTEDDCHFVTLSLDSRDSVNGGVETVIIT